ncbi:hypothetical protein NC653_016690 [Populus alba x Populus x berolinensis]|uniref:MYB transcription factor n=1 Tax=Populus alba x Populus x berolinensis TaxID=444605 RepID=A0AAD6VZI0_9ROSI|nr:hypothetical protein NC653_016687 [Populus alba x Populus x berolinensis]KAJ6993630.1 hypothetical protein NC653_016690 [Populus alba x Populus x berolinensis]
MGNPKQKWTSEEEEALRAGVAKHGTGKWKNIQRDPEFNPYLYSRSNIDLKDKWRNMTVSAGSQSVKDKSRTTKVKSIPDAAAATPLPNPQTSAAAAAAADIVIDDYSEAAADSKTAPKYNAMIFEAISAFNEPNGADTSAIISYIEQRQELPQNFRRQLSSRLRRLVAQEKLEKVQNCYKIKKVSSFGTKTPTPKKEVRPKSVHDTGDTVEGAANDAAYSVAEAENKSFVATEAVKESERVSKMAEDADSLLQLANEILEKCNSSLLLLSLLFHYLLIHALILDLAGLRGEIVIMG